jgi:hypothetical protein
LIIELADCLLGLLGIREFDECEPTFLARFAIQRNRNVRQITDGRKMSANLAFCRVVWKIPDEKADAHCYLIEPMVIRFWYGEVSQISQEVGY